MSEFTSRHEEQLRDYFSGEFAGRMGLRSSSGAQLEHMHRQAINATRDPNVSYMTLKHQSNDSARSEWDVVPDMLAAAASTRRIRARLRRLDHLQIQVLRCAYAPRSAGAPPYGIPELDIVQGAPNLKDRLLRRQEVERILGTFAPLVACVLGEDVARSLARLAASDDASSRRAGKKGLESGRHQAGQALATAHAAYCEASIAQADEDRGDRRFCDEAA